MIGDVLDMLVFSIAASVKVVEMQDGRVTRSIGVHGYVQKNTPFLRNHRIVQVVNLHRTGET